MMQETLFDAARARRTDPATSQDAAKSLTANLGRLHAQIFETLRRVREGLTNSEIAAILNCPRDSISPRSKFLVANGLIEDSGDKRPGPTGRAQIVWKAK